LTEPLQVFYRMGKDLVLPNRLDIFVVEDDLRNL